MFDPRQVINKIYRIQAFCKECVLWMNVSHPNILQLIAVKIKPARTCGFSMISEFMTNGNILNYIRFHEANRLRLVRPLVVAIRAKSLIGSTAGGRCKRSRAPP